MLHSFFSRVAISFRFVSRLGRWVQDLALAKIPPLPENKRETHAHELHLEELRLKYQVTTASKATRGDDDGGREAAYASGCVAAAAVQAKASVMKSSRLLSRSDDKIP